MSLPQHERRSDGAFRQANCDERAKNLSKGYPEFKRVHPETKLNTLREKSGQSSINSVRKWLRDQK